MKPSKIGRPREFDAGQALDRALDVFWRRGYEGASLSELTDAMGITRPSLYAAFGNKEELFRKALDRYAELGEPLEATLRLPNAREAIGLLLTTAVRMMGSDAMHRGCLLVRGALSCSEESEAVREELARRRQGIERAIRDRLIQAREENDLAPGIEPAVFAKYFTTVLNGMSVQAAGGASEEDLLGVAEAAMGVWPA